MKLKNTFWSMRRAALAVVPVVPLLLCACHGSRDAGAGDQVAGEQPAAAIADQGVADPGDGVVLKAEEIQALGLVTAEARTIRSSPEARGFGTVMPHDAIAQVVAELRTANAGVRQSRAALERVRQLAQTPGAMPAETLENAERQAAADLAALQLANQRLSSTLGQDPPWKTSDSSDELLALADGRYKLVRVTLPVAGDELPRSLRVARLESAQGGRSWLLETLWRAPADAAVPGRSLFGLLRSGDLAEGEHLLAWAPTGASEPGVLVPAAAAVLTGGKFYCYIEKKPGSYVRTEFDPGRPAADGYFVKAGIAVGEKIVITGAGQLLAREMNPSKEAE